jgi:hypothetical protein
VNDLSTFRIEISKVIDSGGVFNQRLPPTWYLGLTIEGILSLVIMSVYIRCTGYWDFELTVELYWVQVFYLQTASFDGSTSQYL